MTQGPNVVYNPGFPPTTPMSEKKSTLRKLSKFSFFLSLVTFGCGVAEVVTGREPRRDCMYVSIDRYPYERQECSYRDHVAAGIWCSLMPLVAALLGIRFGKKKTTPRMILDNYGYPAVGAFSMGLLALLEFIYLSKYRSIFRTIQIALIVVAIFNMKLFIIASGLMCCMGGCCQVHDDLVPVMTEMAALPPVNSTTAGGVLTNQAGSTVQLQQPADVAIPMHAQALSITPSAPSDIDAPPPQYSSIASGTFISPSTDTPPT